MRDTKASAEKRYSELLRAQAPHERLAQALGLSESVREIAILGIRQRHPRASAAELRARLAVRLYGKRVAMRMFRHVPDDAL